MTCQHGTGDIAWQTEQAYQSKLRSPDSATDLGVGTDERFLGGGLDSVSSVNYHWLSGDDIYSYRCPDWEVEYVWANRVMPQGEHAPRK
jgi:hypothetical protein